MIWRSACRAVIVACPTLLGLVSTAAQDDSSALPPFSKIVTLKAAEQRQALNAAASRGSLEAAGRMIELDLRDDLAQLRIPVASTPAEVTLDGMTGEQIEAGVAALAASRPRDGQPTLDVREAREELARCKPTNPFLKRLLADLYEKVVPTYPENTAALRQGLSTSFETLAEHADPWLRGACLFSAGDELRPDRREGGDWSRAASHFERAAQAYEEAGDASGLGRSLHRRAWCLQPKDGVGGDWSLAIELYGRAARVFEESGDLASTGTSWYQLGRCFEPSANPAGDWSRAMAAFARSAELRKQAGDLAGSGKSLSEQAWCLQPTRNPAGDWTQAAVLAAQAAQLRRQGLDLAGAGQSLYLQASCMLHGGKDRAAAADARTVLIEARAALTEAGDQAELARVDSLIRWIDEG